MLPTPPTELLLIRHGETDWNRRPCFQGQIDTALNAQGLAQAQDLARRLLDEHGRGPIDGLVVSDLLRARQTAEPVARALRLPAQLAPALREQAFGILEGLSFEEIRAKHPAEFERWARHQPDYALPGGAESRQAFHARVSAALAQLAAAWPGRRLAVVTHGGVLDIVWRLAHGLDLQGPRVCAIPNAGINRVQVRGERFEIVDWADERQPG
ncbi:histidine phosphatase family protein [Roseateles violae]|uniref:Histidine phosphatase family protein n=1 Tax=Roseateles violae TaxID=3058042 RepID=A0ABT8DM36_9BURK|nr:histidine phosphatase family protein [Pelomonas sp. PFR6]MDN3919475.1 histidine phosphatase family protein [Pelomonas sp. PFR6]